MEMDKEIEGQLAQLSRHMQCMGTEDEETLIRNFQQVLSPQGDLDADSCRFFLDMNNWNLQAAVGSFYDYNAQQMFARSLPAMQFIGDVTVGEGEGVQPNIHFIKTWRIRNPGPDQWPPGCSLRLIEGDLLSDDDHVNVEALKPGESADISIMMKSPFTRGVYESRWRMFTDNGLPFGELIWCIINVDECGVLDITQRFASASCHVDQAPQTSSPWSFGRGNNQTSCGTLESNAARPIHANPFRSGIKYDGLQSQNQAGSAEGFEYRRQNNGGTGPYGPAEASQSESTSSQFPTPSGAYNGLAILNGGSYVSTNCSLTGNLPIAAWEMMRGGYVVNNNGNFGSPIWRNGVESGETASFNGIPLSDATTASVALNVTQQPDGAASSSQNDMEN